MLVTASAVALLMMGTGPAFAAGATPAAVTTQAAYAHAAPSGLASSGTGQTSAKFSWTAVAGAPRYRLQISTSPTMAGSTYTRHTGTSAELTGLNAGTTYYAKIRVISILGEALSPYSAAATATTIPAANAVLTVPTGVKATAGETSLNVKWNGVASAPAYRLRVSDRPDMAGAKETVVQEPVGRIEGLLAATAYYAQVQVVGADGKPLTAYSAFVKAGTPWAIAPAALTAKPAQTTAELSWRAVPQAATYRVAYATTPDLAGAVYRSFTGLNGTVKGLTPGTTYYFKVRALKTDGASLTGYSATVSAKTASVPLAPGSFATTTKTSTSLGLVWQAVKDAAQYRVVYSDKADLSTPTYKRFTGTSGVLGWLKANTPYFFQIRALKADGTGLTGYSKTITGTTAANLAPPARLTAKATRKDSADLVWQPVAGAAEYRVAYSLKSDMSAASYRDTATPARTICSLTPNTAYYVQVRALKADGTGLTGYSATTTIRTATATVPPAGLAATEINNDSAVLAWKPVAGAAEYRVAYSLKPDMSGATYRDTDTNGRTIYNLTQGTTYYVQVRALDANGSGITGYSAPITVKTTALIAPPTGLSAATVGFDRMDLTWKPVAGAAKYRLGYSLKADMSVATFRDTDIPARTIYDLAADSLYYVQVKAMDAAGNSITAYSSPLQARTKIAQPLPPAGLTSTRTTPTTMALSWGPVAGAAEYRLSLTKGSELPVYTRHAGTTADVRGLTPGAGYSAQVRALDAAGNSVTVYTSFLKVQTPAVPVFAPVEDPLSVASFNIHCANCIDPVPGEALWPDRRDAVVAEVIERMPDIIGFQEASQAWLKEDHPGGLSQFEDLKARLNAAGGTYEVTNTKRNNCINPQTPIDCVPFDQGASQGSRIFYNENKIVPLRTGSQLLPELYAEKNDRYVAWAEVMQISSGKRFFFANTHLEADKSEGNIELRRDQAEVVMDTIAKENIEKLPVILAGDMNSSKWLLPSNSAYDVIVGAGLIDPLGNTYRNRYASGDATAETVINRSASSFNGYRRDNAAGVEGESGSYIDYIFTSKMRVQLYENVGKYDSSGNRVGVFGSDHNMQFAIVGLP